MDNKEINEIIQTTLDKFKDLWYGKQKIADIKTLEYFTKESNFVKYQKDFNEIFKIVKDIIDKDRIKKSVNKKENITLIRNYIMKIVIYYIFIMIGITYKSKIEQFNNNIIDFNKNQINYELKLEDFFNSESNANIINGVLVAKELISFLYSVDTKGDINKTLNTYSTDLQNIINSYGSDKNIKVQNFIDLIKKVDDKNDKHHIIVKYILIKYIIKEKDITDILISIEQSEINSNEYEIIEIVVSKKESIVNILDIEKILDQREIKLGIADIIYNLLVDDNIDVIAQKNKKFMEYDTKIQQLFNSKIIIPIVDDFLLYHKDDARYEKKLEKDVKKSKDNTKLKYIINQIKLAENLYTNKEIGNKYFYKPLKHKNGVLINVIEDLKLLNTSEQIIRAKTNSEIYDLISELITYRTNPYITFKDFEKNGFNFISMNPTECVRKVSLENNKDNLEMRVLNDTMIGNIVGIIILNSDDEISCLNKNDLIDIKTINKKNPLENIGTILYDRIMNIKSEMKGNYYWMFDLENENFTIPNYNISSSMQQSEVLRYSLCYLYDSMIENIYDLLIKDVNKREKERIDVNIELLNDFNRKYDSMDAPNFAQKFNDLKYNIFFKKSIQIKDTYDEKEDIFINNAIKLPTIKKPITNIEYKTISSKLVKVQTEEEEKEDNEITEDIIVEKDLQILHKGVCQHIITWRQLVEVSKTNNKLFNLLVKEYMTNYIEKNVKEEFVCKSCNAVTEIRDYIDDGTFDNKTQQFVSFTSKIQMNLEEMPEYEKYTYAIRQIDVMIDTLADIMRISQATIADRYKRRNIVKNVLDFAINNNSVLNKLMNEKYKQEFYERYSINQTLSNFYVFEFDNNIFKKASKEKTDLYKNRKYNNIIAYVVICMFIEFNETIILNLEYEDKYVSYDIFKPLKDPIFKNMKIITNRQGEYELITNYPILCYILYMFSGFLVRYKKWINTSDEKVKSTKKIDPLEFKTLQLSALNTIITILNGILSLDIDFTNREKLFVYNDYVNKYFLKLEPLFKNNALIDKLEEKYANLKKKRSLLQKSIDSGKFNIFPEKHQNIIINKKYYNTLRVHKFKTPQLAAFQHIYSMSNLTNCPDGIYHVFKFIDGKIKCSLCNQLAGLDKYNEKSQKELSEIYYKKYLTKLTLKYCINGDLHLFYHDICKRCKFDKNHPKEFSHDKLEKLLNIVENKRIIKSNNIEKLLQDKVHLHKDQKKLINETVDKLMYKYEKKNSDINTSITEILDVIQQLVGEQILLNNELHHLTNDIYVVDHDILGNKLEKTIQVNENKFRVLNNHPTFKRDVIVLNSMYKNVKYDSFYDYHDKYMLGYKESNKEIVMKDKLDCKLYCITSVKNILLTFGLHRSVIAYKDIFAELYENSQFKVDPAIFINKCIHYRFDNIKYLGIILKKYMNRLKNKFKIKLITYEAIDYSKKDNNNHTTKIDELNNTVFDILYDKYFKSIDRTISTEDNSHEFMKHFNIVYNYLNYHSITIEEDFKKNITAEIIINNDDIGNVIYNYILDEILRLLRYNNTNVNKILILYILEIIKEIYNMTNIDIKYNSKHLVNYVQSLYRSDLYTEVYYQPLDIQDYYGLEEIKQDDNQETIEQKKNKQDDEVEAEEAYDVDMFREEDEIDNEDTGEYVNNDYDRD